MFNRREQQIRNIRNLLKQRDRKRPLTHAELLHALTFLQLSSVIDSQEYTRLYTKALPFTKG